MTRCLGAISSELLQVASKPQRPKRLTGGADGGHGVRIQGSHGYSPIAGWDLPDANMLLEQCHVRQLHTRSGLNDRRAARMAAMVIGIPGAATLVAKSQTLMPPAANMLWLDAVMAAAKRAVAPRPGAGCLGAACGVHRRPRLSP